MSILVWHGAGQRHNGLHTKENKLYNGLGWDKEEPVLLCELPDIIVSLSVHGENILAETVGGLYEIRPDGTFIGVRFDLVEM